MKFKKLAAMALGITTIAFYSLTYSGAVDFTDISTEFTKPLSYKESKVGFEFENDTAHSVWIAVKNGDTFFEPMEVKATSLTHEITGSNTIQQSIDINKPTVLAVWFENPGSVSIGKKWKLFGAIKVQPEADLVYTFKQGKTIYVTLNKHYALVPSEAIEGSIATETGLSLENNVRSDISLISSKIKNN